MRTEHLPHLACPSCHGALRLDRVQEEDARGVRSGTLRCSRCASPYPVVRHVPRFVAAENYAAGFGLQWTKHARTQYDEYTGVSLSKTRFFEETRWPRQMQGETILEMGSGSGRFTEHAAQTGAMVVSMDYSSAVDVNHALNGARPNVLIVQADIYRMPVAPGTFDRAFCFGVLQHTPDVHGSFSALVAAVKPDGHVAVDVYRKPEGPRALLATKYWVRPLTRRIPPRVLYRLTSTYVRLMWPLSRLISRIPRIGKKINWLFLVADYRGVYPLSEAHLKEWAILDSFDMLSPVYDNPQSLETVQRWFEKAGLRDIDVRCGYNGIEGRGRKPVGLSEAPAGTASRNRG